MFGQGRPLNDSCAPSVPPRIGTTFGVTLSEFHGLFGYLDYMHYRFDFLTHIIVLVAYVEACALREFMIDLSCEMLEFLFAAFETVAVMIADYVGEHSLFDSALY